MYIPMQETLLNHSIDLPLHMVVIIGMMTLYLVIFAPFIWIMSHGISFANVGLRDDLGMVDILKDFLFPCI